MVWPVAKLTRRIRRSTEKSRSRLADLSQILQETISGNRVVKAFGMEGFEIRKFARRGAQSAAREHALDSRHGGHRAGDGCAGRGGRVHDSFLRARRNQSGPHDDRLVRRVHLCSFQGLRADQSASAAIYQLFVQALGTSAQVFRFLDLPEEKLDAPGAKVLPRFSTSVEFDDATFAYEMASPRRSERYQSESAGGRGGRDRRDRAAPARPRS